MLEKVRSAGKSILLLRPRGCRWRKWAPYLRLAGRGRCTETRP